MSTDPALRDLLLPHDILERGGLLQRADVLAAGYTENEVAAHLRAGRLQRVRPGTYAPADESGPRARHLRLVRAGLHVLSDDAVICDVSAAELHGLPLWGVRLDQVHVSRQRRAGRRRGRLVHVHPAPLTADELVEVAGPRRRRWPGRSST